MPNSLTARAELIGISFDIGTLAYRDRIIFFEFSKEALDLGLGLSPFRMPLRAGLQRFDPTPFEGLSGLFSDSLPDGWGRLLLDRAMVAKGRTPGELTALDRLALVGDGGMGALTYHPWENSAPIHGEPLTNLDDIADQASAILSGESSDVLEGLVALNGSSAGARPKAMMQFNPDTDHIILDPRHEGKASAGYQSWLVKFPNSQDGTEAGAIEQAYAKMANVAGIDMMPTHLFPSKTGLGYFATQRFDRSDDGRHHVHSVAGLLHADFRAPSLDYSDLLNLTERLTRDTREVLKMYRLAVFNVLAHNRDDHAKNFSFIMHPNGEWNTSPAYDLTFSSGPNGEQSMMVMGEGRNPTVEHLRALGDKADIDAKTQANIIGDVREALSKWENISQDLGVSKKMASLISNQMQA